MGGASCPKKYLFLTWKLSSSFFGPRSLLSSIWTPNCVKMDPNEPQLDPKWSPNDMKRDTKGGYVNKLKPTSITKRSHASWKPSCKKSGRSSSGSPGFAKRKKTLPLSFSMYTYTRLIPWPQATCNATCCNFEICSATCCSVVSHPVFSHVAVLKYVHERCSSVNWF